MWLRKLTISHHGGIRFAFLKSSPREDFQRCCFFSLLKCFDTSSNECAVVFFLPLSIRFTALNVPLRRRRRRHRRMK
jgi:hypothetical protein